MFSILMKFPLILILNMIWITIFYGRVSAEQWRTNIASNKSYYVHDFLTSWSNAQSACEARGSRLAVIVDDTDSTFIRGLEERKFEQHWIGLIKEGESCGCVGNGIQPCDESIECDTCRRSWTWVDGTEMSSYLPWACDRPLGDNRACGVIKPAGTDWDATSCSNPNGTRRSICQYDCLPQACKRSQCTFVEDKYNCTCFAGSTGQHCDQDIDECASMPCLNKATCNNGLNEYTCSCIEGYTGYHCETDIDDCSLNPCVNEGTCFDQVDDFNCICLPGYTGVRCHIDFDECVSNPCDNGGTCHDMVNGYVCNCTEDYEGTHCAEGSTENDAGSEIERAFYAGVTLLAITFTCMIIVIALFVRTMPKKGNSSSATKHVETEQPIATTSTTIFNSI